MKKIVYLSLLYVVLYPIVYISYLGFADYAEISLSADLANMLNFSYYDIEVLLTVLFSLPIIIHYRKKFWLYAFIVLSSNFVFWFILLMDSWVKEEVIEYGVVIKWMFINDMTAGVGLGFIVSLIINFFRKK